MGNYEISGVSDMRNPSGFRPKYDQIDAYEYYFIAPCNLDLVRRLHEVARSPTDVLSG
jgi:hypothetical protein